MGKFIAVCAAVLMTGLAAFAQQPESVTDVVKRAAGFSQQGKFEDARRDFELAQTLDPKNASIKMNLAFIYQRLRIYDKATTSFERALSIDDNLLPAHNELALMYEWRAVRSEGLTRRNLFTIALRHWQRVVKLEHDPEMLAIAKRHITRVEERLK